MWEIRKNAAGKYEVWRDGRQLVTDITDEADARVIACGARLACSGGVFKPADITLKP